jgi:hypothetical protein
MAHGWSLGGARHPQRCGCQVVRHPRRWRSGSQPKRVAMEYWGWGFIVCHPRSFGVPFGNGSGEDLC